MRGQSKAAPLWALTLEAADGDPLRAQELAERLEPEWWERWLMWRGERDAAQKAASKKK